MYGAFRFPLLAALGLLLSLSAGCRRELPHAAAAPLRLSGVSLVETHIQGLGTFRLPSGWAFSEGQYPSELRDQTYRMVRASYDAHDVDAGLLSIDISPSHPRLWRRPLVDLVDERLQALGRVGTVQIDAPKQTRPELPYEAEERLVSVGATLRTLFCVFRQKSRVITVAFTASTPRFDDAFANTLVHRVSDSMLLDLPITQVQMPDLTTRVRTLPAGLSAALPSGFVLQRHRIDYSLVPSEVFELTPDTTAADNDRPNLTLSLLHLSALGPGVEVQEIAVPPGGQEIPTASGDRHATVLEVDADTLAAIRVVRLGDDVLTVTYAAPDYLFDVKSALHLLETIARTAALK